jgi:NSS family neurotransmitter:Na+ symporter
MSGGSIVGAAFFAMLLMAALTSSISMLEITTARAIENGRFSRKVAATGVGFTSFLVGLITVFSFSSWLDFYPLGAFETFATMTPFDLIDYLVSNLILPIGGVAYVLFAGWWMKREVVVEELGLGYGFAFKVWQALARVVAPLAVASIFYFNLTV